jgi:hypothetical protein
VGLESHVNRVLDGLGFKRRDWQWSFGDFIARNGRVAKTIVDALNDEGQFSAERDGAYITVTYTGRPSRLGRTPYAGGKPRRSPRERRAELIRYGINPDEMVARALGKELPPATTPKERFRRSLIRHGINPDAPFGRGGRGGKRRKAKTSSAAGLLKAAKALKQAWR